MVFAVQCPNPKCRKFMLVEERERGKTIACLICKGAIRTPAADAAPPAKAAPTSSPPPSSPRQ